MKVFVASLTSRKFLLAVAGVVTLLAERQWWQAAAVVFGYVASEAHVDAKAAAGKFALAVAGQAAAVPAAAANTPRTAAVLAEHPTPVPVPERAADPPPAAPDAPPVAPPGFVLVPVDPDLPAHQ